MSHGMQVRRVGWSAKDRLSLLAAVCLALLFGAAGASAEPANDDCLMCHAERDMTGERDGGTISVWLDAKAYGKSVHAGLECVDCHQDLSGAELPHGEELDRVDCSMCHDAEGASHAASLHGQALARGDEMAPRCNDCHGKHDILSPEDPASPAAIMNVPLLCGGCHREGSPVSRSHAIHQDRILENYSESIHGAGLYEKGLTVTAVCTSCHTSHDIRKHTDAKSSIHHDNITKTCTKCHSRIEQVHRKVIEGKLWEEAPGRIPACVDCHSPHKIRRAFYPAGMSNKDCLTCHGKQDITTIRDGATVSLYVDEAEFAASAHAEKACAQCHSEVSPSRERSCETIKSKVDCSVCHAQQVEQYETSIHGTLHAQGDPDAPVCLDCHSNHATKSKRMPTSPTFARNVPVLCAKCHRAGEKAAIRIEAEVPDIVSSYMDSIHGTGLMKSGLLVTATCTNCHSSHMELPPADPRSTVNHVNIADTCGSCHHGIEETFKQSIHFTGEAKDGRELPTCEDCHTSHTITRADKPGFRTAMMEQCGRCHETEATTFFDTFHGKVSRLGGEGAAKCYDCHGTHDILPTTETTSHLSRQNVVDTCAKCHEGSHRRFAGYLTHATHHDQDRYPWLFWSFWFMTALLIGTLTFALIHTLAWLVRLWLSREEWRQHKALSRTEGAKLVRRFTKKQRGMHLVMMLSFFTLALTGMSLKFSYTGWAQFISNALGGFESMGFLHRIGGLTLFGVFFVHLWDVVRQRRQTKKTWLQMIFGPDSMMFNLNDAKQIVQSIRWFFGLGKRPRYGRFTYWEKFDYFAVFWGVMVIGSTGLALWFPEFFTRILPGWSINVATIIHSDEALLAVGFIFTIHFFNTHFRPDKFPMDPVIFTGRVSLDELKYDKPAEYDALVATGELEQHLVEPIPKGAERGFRIFGFAALTFGLIVVGLIVYAMLFGYR